MMHNIPVSVVLINYIAKHKLERRNLELATLIVEYLYYKEHKIWLTGEAFNTFGWFPRHIAAHAHVKICPTYMEFDRYNELLDPRSPVGNYKFIEASTLENAIFDFSLLDPIVEKVVTCVKELPSIDIYSPWWKYCIGKREEDVASIVEVLQYCQWFVDKHNLDHKQKDSAMTKAQDTAPIEVVEVDDELQARDLFLFEAVEPDSVKDLIQDILLINQEDDAKEIPTALRKPIRLFLNTEGGDVGSAFALYDIIKASKTPVHTYGLGWVYSSGVVIAAAGHRRFAYPHSSWMIHSISSEFFGSKLKIETQVEETRRLHSIWVDLLSSGSNLTKDQVEELTSGEKDNFFTAEEALKLGLVETIIK